MAQFNLRVNCSVALADHDIRPVSLNCQQTLGSPTSDSYATHLVW